MKRFLLIWFFLFISYLAIKLSFNLLYFGWIDLRWSALLELLILPLGQSIAFWLLTYKRKKTPRNAPAGGIPPAGPD